LKSGAGQKPAHKDRKPAIFFNFQIRVVTQQPSETSHSQFSGARRHFSIVGGGNVESNDLGLILILVCCFWTSQESAGGR
jgi:hypothetical protein